MATLEQALARFGVVTVLEPTFRALIRNVQGVWIRDESIPEFTLETLRISNFTQEGPSKTSKGGLNAEIVLRYGKTARLEMEDVVGRVESLKHLMGTTSVTTGPNIAQTDSFRAIADQTIFALSKLGDIAEPISGTINGDAIVGPDTIEFDDTGRFAIITLSVGTLDDGDEITITYEYLPVSRINVTDRFANMFEIQGRTFIVNATTGEREYVYFTVKKFLPDSLFNLTMEAEGDFGVFNLNGELFTDDCGVFYYLTKDNDSVGNCD